MESASNEVMDEFQGRHKASTHSAALSNPQPLEHDGAALDENDRPHILAVEHYHIRILRTDRNVLGDLEHVVAAARVGAILEHELVARARRVVRGLQGARARLDD